MRTLVSKMHSNHQALEAWIRPHLPPTAGESDGAEAMSLATLAIDLRVDRLGAIIVVECERNTNAVVARDDKVRSAR